MPSVRRTGAVVVALASVAGAALVRRRSARAATRVDLYFADGSLLSLPAGDPEADGMLAVARVAVARAEEG